MKLDAPQARLIDQSLALALPNIVHLQGIAERVRAELTFAHTGLQGTSSVTGMQRGRFRLDWRGVETSRNQTAQHVNRILP